MCGKKVITECDIHVVIPVKDSEINCGCFYLGRIKELERENLKIKDFLNSAVTVMERYHKNCGIYPMFKDYATEWLEIYKKST